MILASEFVFSVEGKFLGDRIEDLILVKGTCTGYNQKNSKEKCL